MSAPERHIVLIGCVKTKSTTDRSHKVTPADLYTSPLFAKRMQYAESRNLPWCVLSAKYGVWHPTTLNRPYDETLAGMHAADVAIWHSSVCHSVAHQLWEPFELKQADGPILPSELTIEIHAGHDYCHPLAEMLQALGINVLLPMAGLQIGEQLAWYGRQEVTV